MANSLDSSLIFCLVVYAAHLHCTSTDAEGLYCQLVEFIVFVFCFITKRQRVKIKFVPEDSAVAHSLDAVDALEFLCALVVH